jgi:hypothetical protein
LEPELEKRYMTVSAIGHIDCRPQFMEREGKTPPCFAYMAESQWGEGAGEVGCDSRLDCMVGLFE